MTKALVIIGTLSILYQAFFGLDEADTRGRILAGSEPTEIILVDTYEVNTKWD